MASGLHSLAHVHVTPFHLILRLVLALSLGLTPIYGYSQNPSSSPKPKVKSCLESLTAWTKSLNSRKVLLSSMYKLSPFLLVPASMAVGGDVGSAAVGAAQISGAIFAIDKSLDLVLDNTRGMVNPNLLILLIAGTTNLPEEGASLASVYAGDPTEDVGSVPMGSNYWNPALLVPAIIAATHTRAKSLGLIEEGEKLTLRMLGKTFRDIFTDKEVLKQIGLGGMFATSVALFQAFVRPKMAEGDMSYFTVWATLNAAFLSWYMWKNGFSKNARWRNTADLVSGTEINKVRERVNRISALAKEEKDLRVTEKQVELFDQVLADAKSLKFGEGEDNEVTDLQASMAKVKSELETNPELQAWLNDLLKEEGAEDLRLLFELGQVNTGSEPLTRKQKWLKRIKIIAGVLGVMLSAYTLDLGTVNITEALPGFSKHLAGLVFIALLSSLPETLSMIKVLIQDRLRSAGKLIADSNALNIFIALKAMLISAGF